MKIQVLTDNMRSWFVAHGKALLGALEARGHCASYVFDKKDVGNNDVLFLLSCEKLVRQDVLSRNKHSIVVHASDLPLGKGFSPLQWQILEGKNTIILTLFEAVEEVDAGPIYFKDSITFDGTELYRELREKLGHKIVEMCLRFVDNYEHIKAVEPSGESSFYRRRTVVDDEIDVNNTIAEIFDHLRITDPERHPAWFRYRGATYTLQLQRAKNEEKEERQCR